MINDNGWVEVVAKLRVEGGHTIVRCNCLICGSSFESRLSAVKNGEVKSCGCMKRLLPRKDMTSTTNKYGVTYVGYEGGGLWRVLYKCGHVASRKLYTVENATTGLCSCCASKQPTTQTHGHSPRGRKSRTYDSWLNGRKRCNDPTNNRYNSYGAKGIKFYQPWDDSFEEFLKDMGECPDGYTLERINVFGNYEPSNCCWLKNDLQAGNKKTNIRVTDTVTHETLPLRRFCLKHGFDYKHVWYKLRKSDAQLNDILGIPNIVVVLPEDFSEDWYNTTGRQQEEL